MPVSTSLELSGKVAVLRCQGIISQGSEADRLAQEIGDAVVLHPRLLVDLWDVQNMDSADLKPLVLVAVLSRTLGGDVRFARLPRHLSLLRALIGMLERIGAYDTIEEATASFSAGQEDAEDPFEVVEMEKTDDWLERAGGPPANA